MKRKHQTGLIVFAVILLIGAGYLYFTAGLSSEAATSSSVDNPLSSSAGAEALTITNSEIAQKAEFLNSLISLTTIKIDTTLLQDPAFAALQDNNVKIDPVVAGRPNPFLPTAATSAPDGGTTALSPVVTNDATQITDKSAALNGTINSSSTPTTVYFEYGTSPTLVKPLQTLPAVQSLVNTFVKIASGLTSKTTYYYRAAARVNGAVLYGEINSFTTL